MIKSYALLPVMVAVTVAAFVVHAATNSKSSTTVPFALVNNSTVQEYGEYQIKITYTGPQLKPSRSLLIYGSGRDPDILEFMAAETTGVRYVNDRINHEIISVSGLLMKDLVEKVIGSRPELQSSVYIPDPHLSLMILKSHPNGPVVFEHLCSPTEARTLMSRMRAAFVSTSDETRETVRRMSNIYVQP